MATTARPTRYALCIEADASGDLRVRQVYRLIPDARSEKAGLFRIVDDSGEDYLYPKRYFVPVRIPPAGRPTVQQLFNVGSVPRPKAKPKAKLSPA
jgi:hypothetical protein